MHLGAVKAHSPNTGEAYATCGASHFTNSVGDRGQTLTAFGQYTLQAIQGNLASRSVEDSFVKCTGDHAIMQP